MNYLANMATTIGIYAILTMSLDLLIGYVGLLSLGHAAFFGIGAYTAALAAGAGLDPWLCLLLATIVAGTVSALLAIPTLRLRGDYFVLGTFGIAMMATSVFENWVDLTNGPYGIYGIEGFFWGRLSPAWDAPVMALTTAGLVAFVAGLKYRLATGGFGNTLQAIREDEIVADSLGKNVLATQVTVFAIAGAMAGIAGGILTYQLRFIEPSLFSFHVTIFVWAILFVGGCGSIAGNIASCVILVLFPEILRFCGLSGMHAPQVQQALYGVLLIAVAMFRPQGLLGAYRLR
jgi:branched-chain amino acid transport system permease protein